MATEEQITAINLAMERYNGDRECAHVELGITRRELTDLITQTPILLERWGGGHQNVPEPTPLTDLQAINRPALPPVVSPVPMSPKLNDEQRKTLFQSLHAMGVDGDVVRQSVAFLDFAQDFYLQSVQMMHGGLAQTFLLMCDEYSRKLTRQKTLEALLDDTETFPFGDAKRISASIEFDQLSKQLRELNTQITMAKKVVEQGVIQQALVLRGMDKKEKRVKPKQAGNNSEIL